MPPTIHTSYERRRGCGFRQRGGLYIVTDAVSAQGAGGLLEQLAAQAGGEAIDGCPKLPVELTQCPTCRCGIKPARGWQYVDADAILRPGAHGCNPRCVLNAPIGQAGLIWIGGAFYASPTAWLEEARDMGVSRRIRAIPRGLQLGSTWVLVAHQAAVEKDCAACGTLAEVEGEACEACNGTGSIFVNGIFSLFKPQRIEYIVNPEADTPESLERLEERGVRLVDVIPVGEAELAQEAQQEASVS